MRPTSSLTLVLAALLAAACNAVGYDFGIGDPPDAGDPSLEACLAAPLADADCPVGSGDCETVLEVGTARLGAPVGCTPAGLALGVVRIPGQAGSGELDLVSWVEPGLEDTGLFAAGAALSLFGAKCESPLGGEPGQNCAFEPYLVAAAVGVDQALYLHVQTPLPTTAAARARVGLQLLHRESWRALLPAAGEPLSCRLADGELLSDLVAEPPWGGSPATIDTSHLPPALEGEPWICASASGGWRQVAFLLRNSEDAALRVTRLRLTGTGEPGAIAGFHFGLYRCLDDGAVASELAALASSCHDSGDHASKSVDALVEPWIPGLAETEYVLVLQVPPGPERLFDLVIDSEPAATE
ncbi:MAG TPA: hypothetical protein VM285_03420 [Polyangia bacterium]|nr:hypothetical protein [Polyangia bacterium]